MQIKCIKRLVIFRPEALCDTYKLRQIRFSPGLCPGPRHDRRSPKPRGRLQRVRIPDNRPPDKRPLKMQTPDKRALRQKITRTKDHQALFILENS